MKLQGLQNRTELRRAFNEFKTRVIRGTKEFKRTVGYRGGNHEFTVHWNPRERFWALFDPKYGGTRYACYFGTQDPNQANQLSISAEINPPHEAKRLDCAGVFARDDNGQLFICHTGRVHGVSLERFRASHGGDWQTVSWTKLGKRKEVTVIAPLASPELQSLIHAFITEVARIKATKEKQASKVKGHEFKPEFEGPRESYDISKTIQTHCHHGPVVNTLRAELEQSFARKVGRDKHRDLFILRPDQSIEMLFEVKTNLLPKSIYEGIGQLLLHGATSGAPTPQRVLVVPGAPNSKTAKALKRIGIRVLRYRWGKGRRPRFLHLKALLAT